MHSYYVIEQGFKLGKLAPAFSHNNDSVLPYLSEFISNIEAKSKYFQ